MGHMAQMAISWPPRSGRSGVWLSGSGGLDLWIWRAGHLDLALGAMRSSVLDGAARQGLKGPPGPYSRTAGGMSLWCGDLGTRSSIGTRLGVQSLDPDYSQPRSRPAGVGARTQRACHWWINVVTVVSPWGHHCTHSMSRYSTRGHAKDAPPRM